MVHESVFSSAKEAILYYANQHPEGLIEKVETDQETIVFAGGHPLRGDSFVKALNEIISVGQVTHDVGENYLLTEEARRVAADIKPIG